ncbi:hypothetical protein IC762_12900 [Bradyrhizobium genosp. L]|uniref:hypothetical protein n=1 Tax=Bradyrhizobium genosp. L TaxID=83637 RepID=UPI0018A3339E|nr:hypothetical protein [Bradyrhizobium genosp. L]QPF88441.1 hypothetical protein IC762_12900 [Bradyrhizobium genosp. L]
MKYSARTGISQGNIADAVTMTSHLHHLYASVSCIIASSHAMASPNALPCSLRIDDACGSAFARNLCGVKDAGCTILQNNFAAHKN